MTLHLHWFLPTAGDSRDVVGFGPTSSRRDATIDHLATVAKVAEEVGFDAVLTPTGTFCEDAWITTAALIRETRRLRFLVAFRPGLLSPTLAAQQAATFQRLSGGRLLLNVVTGGSAVEQRRFGDHLDHDLRYDRCDEFLTVLRGAWSATERDGFPPDSAPAQSPSGARGADRPGARPAGFDFTGRHFAVEGALATPTIDPQPAIFFGGSSEAGKNVAARQADVWLMWGEPPASAAAEIADVRARAAAVGRDVRFGIRLHTITRDRAADAWAEADRLVEAMPPEVIARAQRIVAETSDSVGQARMAALHGGRTEGLVIAPNLWAGFGLVRGGAGTALVGSHDEVAERVLEYHRLGFDHVILSGQPHVEEAYWFGEGVLPRLRAAGVVADPGAPIRLAATPTCCTHGMNVVALNGSPSSPSRSRALAVRALDLAGGGRLVDLADLDPAALLALATDATVDEVRDAVGAAEVLIVATPVYRATYTALTKTIFDLLPTDALRRTVVVPIASGYGASHELAVDHGLRPLVASVGGVTVPTGVYAVRDDVSADGVLSPSVDVRLSAAVAEALALSAALNG